MKRLLFFIGLALVPLISFSQQESYYTLYRFNMNVINPAYAGALGKNVFAFTSRRQWSSMEDAPSTLAFSYSSERENNVGLGFSVVSDKVFIEQQTFAYADFSYKLDMESTQLYLGLKAGG
ncbi:type IX secretion system membrane protein PorP/SprF, partial [Flavobacteriaceae bacterium]|nr:type IX secretion system membrane protein PorP/SprF [Flavobacteriaceae bacterium]